MFYKVALVWNWVLVPTITSHRTKQLGLHNPLLINTVKCTYHHHQLFCKSWMAGAAPILFAFLFCVPSHYKVISMLQVSAQSCVFEQLKYSLLISHCPCLTVAMQKLIHKIKTWCMAQYFSPSAFPSHGKLGNLYNSYCKLANAELQEPSVITGSSPVNSTFISDPCPMFLPCRHMLTD